MSQQPFVPLLLGADINVYSMARAFHEQYGLKTVAYGMYPSGVCVGSDIIDYRVCPNNDAPDVVLSNVKKVAREFADRKVIVLGCGDNYLTSIACNLPNYPENVIAPYVSLDMLETLIHKEKFYDLCDKYGIDYENITTLEQLHDALTIVHENEPNLVCVVPSNGELVRNWGWDPLGDASTPLGVLMDMGQSVTVVNLFETDFYKEFVTTMRQWYNEGLIMADAVSNTENVGTMMGAGTAFGGFMNLKPYFNVQETTNYGTEIVVSEIVPAFSCTSNVSMATWAIASSTEHPEACMKLLNLMYTDPTLMNLMIYGLEGEHYVVKGDASNGQKIIGYPDGIDATTTTYRPSGGWLWCNQFVGHVWEGNPADYWDVTRAFNNTAVKSNAFGFTWDSSGVRNQVTACTNVMQKYHQALMCGAVDPEETLPKVNQELKDAGIDDIIGDKQAQYDAWRAQNGR